MTQIEKIEDKIKGEIETAELYEKYYREKSDANYIWKLFYGKKQALKDLQQWIKDNIKED